MSTLPFIDIHTHRTECNSGVLCIPNVDVKETKLPRTIYSAGIHPWSIEKGNTELKKKELKKLVSATECIAIGETGLDRVIATDMLKQVEVFAWHYSLSEQLQKPLILHCVRAFNELIETRKTIKATQAWVLHGFNKKEHILKDVLKHGFYVSFGEALLNEKSNAYQYFASVPDNRIFLETDMSEHVIEEIYDRAAFLKKTTVEQLKNNIHINYKTVFTYGR